LTVLKLSANVKIKESGFQEKFTNGSKMFMNGKNPVQFAFSPAYIYGYNSL